MTIDKKDSDERDADDAEEGPASSEGDAELDALLAQVAATPDVHAAGDEDLLLGRTLGRFVVTSRVGKGGMGVVYRARDPSLRRDVALKVLPDASARDPQRRARFLREARAAAALTHPGIAAIHDVGFDEDAQVAWIAMELIDGHDLRAELSKGPLPIAEAERLALQIARALARAHAAGIVHRDLKPENVMLTAERDAKVLDFGLAKQITTALDTIDAPSRSSDGVSTQEGVIVGTPGYMAPEQVLGRSVDARTDVFSFGVLLQEMLTGRAPFVGDTPMATALAVTRDPPAPLARDDVPAALRSVVVRCLEKEPAARFADGRALVDALASTLGAPAASGPVVKPPVLTQETPSLTLRAHEAQTALAHAREAPRRARARVALGALAIVVVLGATAAFVRWRATPASPEDTLRALLMDPGSKIACPPFAVSGDIEAKELGTATAGLVCQALMAWRWSPEKFDGPAAMLRLPQQGSASFPEDPFFTDEGARALQTAAATYPAVVQGDINVDKDGTRVTLRVHVRGAAAPLVIEGPRLAGFTSATVTATRTLLTQLRVESVRLPEEERAVVGLADSREGVDVLELAEIFLRDRSTGCRRVSTEFPLLAGRLGPMCGHAERGTDGVPLWPPGLAAEVARLPEPARTRWLSEWATEPEALRAFASTLRAARKERTGILASELAFAEGRASLRAGDMELARTALDVAVTFWPGNEDAWATRFSLEADAELALRAATAWQPHQTLWSHRAYWTKDARKALPMEELNYFLTGRAAEQSIGLGNKLFELGLPERVRALASFHLDRDNRDDARAGRILLALHEWGTGRVGAASDRLRAAIRAEERLDYLATVAIGHLLPLDTLLNRDGTENDVLQRFVLTEPPRVTPGTMYATSLLDLCIGASPDLARRGLAAVRAMLESGILLRTPDTDLGINGRAMLIEGDAKGAAALWRIYAGEYGPPINALAFLRAGEDDLAEKHLRMYVGKFTAVPRMNHVRLARLLAKRGALEEAKPIAQAFVTAYERTDVEVPAVKEMKALLAQAPTK